MAEERSAEEVPGMALAIERRRRELGLTPGAFAAAAGVTAQGLSPLRKGYRRQYQDKLKLGVARALQWPPDAIDRLLAGEDPSIFEPEPTPPGGAATAEPEIEIAALIGQLDTDERALLEGFLRSILGRRRDDDG